MENKEVSATDFETDDVISRVSKHMMHLSEVLSSTESVLATHFDYILMKDPVAIDSIQKIDYLHQSIVDTANLLAHLGQGCKDQTLLLEGVNLETTKNLISECPIVKEHDEIDFF